MGPMRVLQVTDGRSRQSQPTKGKTKRSQTRSQQLGIRVSYKELCFWFFLKIQRLATLGPSHARSSPLSCDSPRWVSQGPGTHPWTQVFSSDNL